LDLFLTCGTYFSLLGGELLLSDLLLRWLVALPLDHLLLVCRWRLR
jgi:hypothetical protein